VDTPYKILESTKALVIFQKNPPVRSGSAAGQLQKSTRSLRQILQQPWSFCMSNLRVKAGHLPLTSPGLIDGDARLRLLSAFF